MEIMESQGGVRLNETRWAWDKKEVEDGEGMLYENVLRNFSVF